MSDALRDFANAMHQQLREKDAEIERLQARLDEIKRHWQFGVQDIDNAWKRKMAELVGDTEGLEEAVENERLQADLSECRRLLRRALECMDYGQVMTHKDSEAAREAAGGGDEWRM